MYVLVAAPELRLTAQLQAALPDGMGFVPRREACCTTTRNEIPYYTRTLV